MKKFLQKLTATLLCLSTMLFCTTEVVIAQCGVGQTSVPFAFTGTAQSWIVPAGVTSVTITSIGGSGGTGSIETSNGGTGAAVSGTFTVAPGNNLLIVVGGAGANNTNPNGNVGGGGGGGGGTAVFNTSTATLLLVAGGGGGSSSTVGQGGQAIAGAGTGGASGAGATSTWRGSGGGGGGSLNAVGGSGTGAGIPAGGGVGALGASGGTAAIGSGDNGGGNGGYGAGGGGGGGDGDRDGAPTGGLGAGGGGGGGGFTGGAGSPTDGRDGGLGGGSMIDVSGTATTITAGTNGGATITPANGSVVICYTAAAPLAVNFLSFEARSQGANTAALVWKTSKEENNDYFVVQHSLNGIDFADLDKQEPIAAANGIRTYDYIHKNAIKGVNYYRIKQVDMNGQENFSDIRTVVFKDGKELNISISPTVADKSVFANIVSVKDKVLNMTITNVSGQIVQKQPLNVMSGSQRIEINTSNLAAGVHFININDGEAESSFKIIKK